MSDDPSRYWFGIEEPVLPVILAAVLVPAAILVAFWCSLRPVKHLIEHDSILGF